MNKIKIAPSMLSSDFSQIGEQVKFITECGADVIHLDVMDGNFVPNITFGPKFVKDLRKYTNAIFDVHLMILNPIKYVENFAQAGADIITVHYEACKDSLRETLLAIKALGVKCGAVINPDTPVDKLANVMDIVDMVLLMSVFPGFGGQKFIDSVLPKISQVKEMVKQSGRDIDIEIDGGITKENVSAVKKAGANIIVAGNTVFKAPDKAKIIKELREI